jgi:glutathione S-transferase
MQRDVARLDEAYADSGAFLAGSELSLGDLFVAPIVATLAMFPEGQQALGNAKRLASAFEKLRARPSFQEVHAGLG